MDAGTAGCSNFEAFYASTVVPSQVRIKSYINMYGTGQSDYNIMDRFRVEDYRPQAIARMVDRYRDNILGLKIRMSEGVAENMEALDATIALAGELGVGVCVHVSKPLVPLNEIADRLRPGDIFCHVYQNVGIDNIFEADTGKVKQSIWKAREQGRDPGCGERQDELQHHLLQRGRGPGAVAGRGGQRLAERQV